MLSLSNLQSSPHICRVGSIPAPAVLRPRWITTMSHASCPHRPRYRPRVGFRARSLHCRPLTLKKRCLGLPIPTWVSKNSSVLSQGPQVRVQQRPTWRYGHTTSFHTFYVLQFQFLIRPPCFGKLLVRSHTGQLYFHLSGYSQKSNFTKWNTRSMWYTIYYPFPLVVSF